MTQYVSSPTSTSPSGPPPPPPPPPPAAAPSNAAKSTNPADVFAELNKGEAVTQGLRKVDKSEMTHKNPALRGSAPPMARTESSSSAKKPTKPSKPAALSGKKPPKFALEGNKWLIVGSSAPHAGTRLIYATQEHQENESSLIVDETGINQVVSLFACKNTTVQIKGKVNAVSLRE